jgi:hypothetical protein
LNDIFAEIHGSAARGTKEKTKTRKNTEEETRGRKTATVKGENLKRFINSPYNIWLGSKLTKNCSSKV